MITSVHFPGNAGMYPYADSFQVQTAQNALRRVEAAKAETPNEEKGEGRGTEKTTARRTVLD